MIWFIGCVPRFEFPGLKKIKIMTNYCNFQLFNMLYFNYVVSSFLFLRFLIYFLLSSYYLLCYLLGYYNYAFVVKICPEWVDNSKDWFKWCLDPLLKTNISDFCAHSQKRLKSLIGILANTKLVVLKVLWDSKGSDLKSLANIIRSHS